MKKQFFQFLYGIGFIFTFTMLYLLAINLLKTEQDKQRTLLDDHWDITMNDENYEDMTLSSFFYPPTNTGDIITLKTTLPQVSITHPVLQLRIYHCTIEISLDGTVLYQHGDELKQQGKMVGSGYFYISIPDDFQGKELTIHLHVTEDVAFSNFTVMTLQEEKNAIPAFIFEHIIEILICIFLLVLGFVLVIMIVFFKRFDYEYRILFWLGLFSIFMSLWIMSYYGITQVFTFNYHFLSHVEYMSLFLSLLPMLIIIFELQNDTKIKKSLFVFVILIAIMEITFFLLNWFDIAHYPKFLMFYHSIVLLLIVLSILSIIKNKAKKKSEHFLASGLFLFLLFSLIEVLSFNFNKYIHFSNYSISFSILPMGILVFVVFILGSYIHKMLDIFNNTAEQKLLLEIAYTDSLTGVGNRTKCSKILQALENSTKEFSIINFDLNNFKDVNDSFGHYIGDELLIRFSHLLKEIFHDLGFVGRMGGDEFIVVLDYNDENLLKDTISKLTKRIDEENSKKEYQYKIDTAYGYVSNKEHPKLSPWQIYELSDKKMYALKMIQKQKNRNQI